MLEIQGDTGRSRGGLGRSSGARLGDRLEGGARRLEALPLLEVGMGRGRVRVRVRVRVGLARSL